MKILKIFFFLIISLQLLANQESSSNDSEVLHLSELVVKTNVSLASMSDSISDIQKVLSKQKLKEREQKAICNDLTLLEEKSAILIELNFLNDLFLSSGTDERFYTLPSAKDFDQFFNHRNINHFIALANEVIAAGGYCGELQEDGFFFSLDFQWYRLFVEPYNNEELHASLSYMLEIIDLVRNDINELEQSESYIRVKTEASAMDQAYIRNL